MRPQIPIDRTPAPDEAEDRQGTEFGAGNHPTDRQQQSPQHDTLVEQGFVDNDEAPRTSFAACRPTLEIPR